MQGIEELPVALGLLLVAGGDYRDTVLGAVNYGRDSDSIATMGGAIAGALGGAAAVPERVARRPWRRPAGSTSSPRRGDGRGGPRGLRADRRVPRRATAGATCGDDRRLRRTVDAAGSD